MTSDSSSRPDTVPDRAEPDSLDGWLWHQAGDLPTAWTPITCGSTTTASAALP